MGRWSGEQSEDSSTLWELGRVVGSPEDQTQGKGHLAEINSLSSLRESHLDSLWAGVVPLVLEFCITYHFTSHCCTMLVHSRYSINIC